MSTVDNTDVFAPSVIALKEYEETIILSESGLQNKGKGSVSDTASMHSSSKKAGGPKTAVALASSGALNSFMTGDGDYVYFAEPRIDASTGPVLCKVSRMRPDGSDYRCIYEGKDGSFISELALAGDWLVVSAGKNIVTMMKDGSEAHIIVAGASGYVQGGRFAVNDGKVFFPAVTGPGSWEIRSCQASGSDNSVVCSGDFAQGSSGPHVEGVANGRVLFTTGTQDGSSSFTYTLWSAPAGGGKAVSLAEASFGKVAVVGERAYLVDGDALVSLRSDGSDRSEVCTVAGNGAVSLYNITGEVAYLGAGSSMWRVSLADGQAASLGEQHFESSQMEIVDGQVYFHYGIEGRIRKVDVSMAEQGDYWRM